MNKFPSFGEFSNQNYAGVGAIPLSNSDYRLMQSRDQIISDEAVGFGDSVMNWVGSVMDHIAEDPLSFAFTLGAAVAIRGAISGGMLMAFGISGGLPALAVAMGAAMATSLIIDFAKNIGAGLD